MRTIPLLLTFLFFVSIANAQQSIKFKYDENGNRILREFAVGVANRPANNEDRNETLSKVQSIDEKNNLVSLLEGKIMLYPNPTKGIISISLQLSNLKSQEWHYVITDISGKEIYKQKAIGNQSSFDISAYADGFYICTVWIGTEPSAFKFVKNKN